MKKKEEMEEEKRKEAIVEAAKIVTQVYVDRGLIIEAGWASLKLLSIPENAPQVQIDEMRAAFFCGASHLFSSIMTVLDPDGEASDKDLERMSLIQEELDRFLRDYKSKHNIE